MWVNISNCPAHLERFPYIIEPTLIHLMPWQCPPTASPTDDLYSTSGSQALLTYQDTVPVITPLQLFPCNMQKQQPDLILWSSKMGKSISSNLPFDSMKVIKNAQIRKREKTNYQLVLSDLDARGVQSSFTTLEIWALGHSLHVTNVGLRKIFLKTQISSSCTC